MTDTNAAETPAADETKEKKAKAPKEPKAQPRVWIGSTASREGAVYHRLQVLAAQNPGLERDALIKKLIADGFTAKNSKKFEENPEQFIGGYITAGERKGFFTFNESKAQSEPTVAAVTKKESAPKGPTVTESGRALLSALKDGLGDRFKAGEGLPVKEVAEAMKKNKSQLSRTLDKLVKEKYVETDSVEDGDTTVDYVYLLQGGVDIVNAPAEAPAAAE